jgi:hypothetical protein
MAGIFEGLIVNKAGAFVLAFAFGFFSAGALAHAEEVVTFGSRALLNKPSKVRASAILFAGGDGALNIGADGSIGALAGNQLVRTRQAYARMGIATLTVDLGVDLSAAAQFMRKLGGPLAFVGTSRGTLRAAQGLSAGPDRLVLTSGFLTDVESGVGSASALPPTLVVEHRHDECRFTPPEAVAPFQQWGGAKVKVVWLDGGLNEGDPCEAMGHHGFNGLDGQVVGIVGRFVLSGR